MTSGDTLKNDPFKPHCPHTYLMHSCCAYGAVMVNRILRTLSRTSLPSPRRHGLGLWGVNDRQTGVGRRPQTRSVKRPRRPPRGVYSQRRIPRGGVVVLGVQHPFIQFAGCATRFNPNPRVHTLPRLDKIMPREKPALSEIASQGAIISLGSRRPGMPLCKRVIWTHTYDLSRH